MKQITTAVLVSSIVFATGSIADTKDVNLCKKKFEFMTDKIDQTLEYIAIEEFDINVFTKKVNGMLKTGRWEVKSDPVFTIDSNGCKVYFQVINKVKEDGKEKLNKGR